VVTQFTAYARGNEKIFANEFLEPADDRLMDELYSVDDFLYRLRHIVETYYSFDDGTITRFVLDRDTETGAIFPITLSWNYRTSLTVDNAMVVSQDYSLTAEDPLGPFNVSNAKLKHLLSKTTSLSFSFSLSSIVPTQFLSAPFRWSIDIHFKNVGGIFTGQVSSTRHIENRSLLYKLGWIPILLILVATVSLSLQVKAIIASLQIYWRTRSAFNSIPKDQLKLVYDELWLPGVIPVYEWKDVPLGVKLDFFGSWYGLEILGEVSILIACFHGLVSDLGLPISDFSRVFLGAGFLVICVGFAKYLEYWKKFYMLILTMQGSFQRNLRFVISVLPLYMGFCTCGFIIFSPYTDDFASLDKSAITLFALLNGDDIHAQFDRIYARYPYPIIGQVFLFTFIIMFITLVLNIFLFIIEDAYHAAKDFVNTKAERHSRVHRRKDSREGGGALPRLGDIEFDLPTLFDVIEAAEEHIPAERKKHIRKRDRSKLTSVALSVGTPSINGDLPGEFGGFSLSDFGGSSSHMSSSLITPSRTLGAAISSTFGGMPAGHDWGGRSGETHPSPRPSGLARTRSSGLTPRGGSNTNNNGSPQGPQQQQQLQQQQQTQQNQGIPMQDLPTKSSSGEALSSSHHGTSSSYLGTSSSSFVPVGMKSIPMATQQPHTVTTTIGNTQTGSSSSAANTTSQIPKKPIKILSFGSMQQQQMQQQQSTHTQATHGDLSAAIANTIASSQAEFLLEVDEKMKMMRERFASKLQADLEALLTGGGAAASPTSASTVHPFDAAAAAASSSSTSSVASTSSLRAPPQAASQTSPTAQLQDSSRTPTSPPRAQIPSFLESDDE